MQPATTIVAYEKSRILSITKDGLEYFGDERGKRLVDFSTCHKNFIAIMPSLTGKEPKYVGFRDFGAKPPHVTLLTDPPTKFEFPMPKEPRIVPGAKFLQSDPEDFRDFEEFRMQLLEVGVETGDLA